jgi:membrane protein required for beta-lactamase induction
MPGMEILYQLLVVAHLLGMAALVGTWFTVLRAPRIAAGMVHGALLQLVTGIAMVGLRESGAYVIDEPLDRVKITVKLGVALIVVVLGWVNRKREDPPAGLVHTVGGLAVVNVVVAAMWN